MHTMDRVTELSILYEISGLPTRLKDLDQIARLATEKAARLLGSDVAVCYLYQSRQKVLHPQGARGIRARRLADLPLAELDAAITRAIAEKRPLAWHSGAGDAVPNLLGPRYPVQAAIGAPMRIDDELLGFIYAARLKSRPFSESEQSLYGVLADRVASAVENARSFLTLERRVGELQTLNQVGQVLAQSLEIEELLTNLHAQVAAVMDANTFFVTLVDEAADEWVTVFHLERGERQPVERMARRLGLTGYIMRTGRALLLSTQDENMSFLRGQGVELIGEQAKSWLGVPLVMGQDVVGVMAVQSYEHAHRYDEHDRALLTTIASQAAVALDNARLFQDVEEARREQLRQFRQLEALHRLTLALSEKQRDLNTVMELLMERALVLLNCDGGALWLWRERDENLELVYEKQQTGDWDRVGRVLRPGDGLVGRAYAERRMVAVDDYANWPGRTRDFADIPFVSALAAPLIWQDDVIGVLTFDRAEKRPFIENERYLAELLVAQAAAALQNTRLLESTRLALDRTRALYQAGRSLIAFDNLEEALTSAAEGAAQGIQAQILVIQVVNTDTRVVEHIIQRGPGASDKAFRISFDDMWQGLSGLALRELKPVFSPKWMIPDPRESAEAHRRRVEYGVGSLIIAPMQYRGQVLGMLMAINAMKAPDFHERDVEMVAAIANQAAAAITNARLLRQMRRTLNESERRAMELRAATEVAEAISSILDIETLLPQVVQVIRERFDLYYAGLFLVDEAGRWAVLRAGTGAAGQAMLAADHRLLVGGESMIGTAISGQRARIALDVGEEAVRFDNPHLPETRSEMALPLISRGGVIGAMTIQSTEADAFSAEDIVVLQTVANQVAVAIDNARLFAESRRALDEMEAVQRRYLGQAWSEFLQTQMFSGYQQSREGLSPLAAALLPDVDRVLAAGGQPLVDTGADTPSGAAKLVVPIKFREQPIGALGLKADVTREWSGEDIALAEAIAEQLALAAENLRLLDETQRRAARERLTREITDKMRRATSVEDLIETAAREVASAFGSSDTFVQLGPPETASQRRG